jgi:hypothetical protein
VTLAATASRSPPRLTRWETIGGVVLPLLSAAGQVLVLHEDIVGPWLSWGYTPLGILALFAATIR